MPIKAIIEEAERKMKAAARDALSVPEMLSLPFICAFMIRLFSLVLPLLYTAVLRKANCFLKKKIKFLNFEAD